MGIIAWIVLGLIAGAIAKAIMPGNDPGGYRVLNVPPNDDGEPGCHHPRCRRAPVLQVDARHRQSDDETAAARRHPRRATRSWSG